MPTASQTKPTARSPLKPLRDCLIAMDLVHQRIESAMETKKRIIVSGDAEGLIRQDQELLTLGQELNRLECRRREIIAAMNLAGESLEAVYLAYGKQAHAMLNDVRARLQGRLARLAELNRETSALLELSIHWIHDTIRVISEACEPQGSSYDAKGQRAGNRYASRPATPAIQSASTIQHQA